MEKQPTKLEQMLKNPPKEVRPVPFWSWNERLSTEETAWQIGQMEKAGLGGYFMHARGGLQTPYMGEEWMDNIRTGIREGKKRGMSAWGYDENGWPSGFGGGAVNGLGVEYQQKYLRFAQADGGDGENTICTVPFEGKQLRFYYEVNPFYVDTLDAAVTKKFLESTHEAYREKLGGEFTDMAGFFTDEPQVSRSGIPWSFVLPDRYREAYGEELLPNLPALFFETEGYERVRFRFWSLVRDLFTDGFTKQIYDWCEENGTRLTGHMVLEESMESQLVSNGACMPSYEFFHIPGVDWLGRIIGPSTTAVQVASVARQLGRRQVLSESFALCGWDVSFEELKWIAEWQMVRGVNLLCPHLEGYSLRGIRKRDYPATLYYQQPWWEEYRELTDALSRIGLLLTEGEASCPVLVLHPMSSAWLCYNDRDNGALRALDAKFLTLLHGLEDCQVHYDLGDERILERHGVVEENRLRVGQQSYAAVVVPDARTLSAHTVALLEQYQKNGGLLFFGGQIPDTVDGETNSRVKALAAKAVCCTTPAEIADRLPDWMRPVRIMSDGPIHGVASTIRTLKEDHKTFCYLVNSAQEARTFTLSLPGRGLKQLDYQSGNVLPVVCQTADDRVELAVTLPAMGSLLLFLEEEETAAPQKAVLHPLDGLDREWQIAAGDPNAITLDYCDCYFDGKLVAEHCPITSVQGMACALGRPVELELVFSLAVKTVPEEPCWLVLETPEIFAVTINGKPLSDQDCGYYFDKSFRKRDLSGMLQKGENEIRLKTRFVQSEAVYENIEKSRKFESEKNKLTYDMEIEAIYVVGGFGVDVSAGFTTLERNALRTNGSFALTDLPKSVRPGALAKQGFPFFSGKMTLKTTVTLTAAECENRMLSFAKRCAAVTKVRVNGKDAGTVLWQPYQVDLSGLLHEGENEIEIELTGSLRNLLGPHHLEEGEGYFICPTSFFKESDLWGSVPWNDGYCFTEAGLFF